MRLEICIGRVKWFLTLYSRLGDTGVSRVTMRAR
ncbi:Uncharacterised protein [Bordetella pertussis]|nr:Uncharacterised protein [Bordetella pertussis]